MTVLPEFAAIVIAGGAGRRLGGTDKPGRLVGGRPMISRVLDAVAAAQPKIVVGPRRWPLPDDVLWTHEEPAGGGPVAAVGAGLACVTGTATRPAGLAPPPYTAVLAADLPFLTGPAVDALLLHADLADADVALYLDDTGRRQLLCGVWRTAALARRLVAMGKLAGVPMRAVTTGLIVAEVQAPADVTPPWFDCDTEADLHNAEKWWV